MIREATEHDAGAIADIYNHYILHSVATFEEEPWPPWFRVPASISSAFTGSSENSL